MRFISFFISIIFILNSSVYGTELEQKASEIIQNGWNVGDVMYHNCDEGIVNDCVRKYRDSIEDFACYIRDQDSEKEFQDFYNEQDVYTKNMLNPVVSFFDEYRTEYGEDTTPFPGYGYPEPGYNYRRGAELKRDLLSVFWRKEERNLETSQENELTIEIRFLADFTNGIQNHGAGEIKSMEQVNMHINGELKECVRIRYTIKKSLRVNCTVKYQKTRVWFELFKQKAALWYVPWQNNPWERCGNTYSVSEEATGEEIADDFSGVDRIQENNTQVTEKSFFSDVFDDNTYIPFAQAELNDLKLEHFSGENDVARAEHKYRAVHFLGLGGFIFSTGLYKYQKEYGGTVHTWFAWKSAAKKIAEEYKTLKKPVVIIGHSLGARSAVECAGYLQKKNIPIHAVITLDYVVGLTMPGLKKIPLYEAQSTDFRVRNVPAKPGNSKSIRKKYRLNHIQVDKDRQVREDIAVWLESL